MWRTQVVESPARNPNLGIGVIFRIIVANGHARCREVVVEPFCGGGSGAELDAAIAFEENRSPGEFDEGPTKEERKGNGKSF